VESEESKTNITLTRRSVRLRIVGCIQGLKY